VGSELISVEEAARLAHLTLAEVRRLIESGDIPSITVEVDGQLEVRVPLKDVKSRARRQGPNGTRPLPRPRSASSKGPRRPRGSDAGSEPTDPSTALVPPGAPGSAISITPEIRQLASGLAEELFQRWELAMQQRLEDELKVRLKSELEHRQHQAEDLAEELDQRVRGAFGPGGTKIIGMVDRYATWERERKLIHQSREFAEMQRQMTEMRQRLRDLGLDPDESTITVEPELDEPEHTSPPEKGPDR
jgi:hypothetical protein